MFAAQWIALAGIVIVGLAYLTELVKWRASGSVISRRHKVMRTSLALLMEIIFGLVWFGPLLTHGRHVLTQLIYWMVCMLLALAVFVLAALEVKEVAKQFMTLNRRVFREFMDDTRRDIK